MTGNSFRFKDFNSLDLNSDLLNYHLKHLIEKRYIEKKESIYRLTEKGVKFISSMGLEGNIYQLFKVSIVVYLFNNDKLLTQIRKRKPFLNTLSTISGKVLWGETYEEASKRKLIEESGLKSNLKYVGTIRKTRKNAQNVVLEDTIYNICVGYEYEGSLIEENEYGINKWIDIDNAMIEFKKNPDFGNNDFEILNRLRNKELSIFNIHQIKEVEEY